MEKKPLRFPLFIDLENRPVIVIGGGKIGLRRAEALWEFGANVTIIAPMLMGELSIAAKQEIIHLPRSYIEGDLVGFYLAVTATDNRDVNYQVGQEANRLGVLVSVADRREECSFFFPAICKSGDGEMIAGLVSNGEDHNKTATIARNIRDLLEGKKSIGELE